MIAGGDYDLILFDVGMPHPLSKCVEVGRIHRRRRRVEHPDAPYLRRLLRPGGERRGKGTGQRGHQQRRSVRA